MPSSARPAITVAIPTMNGSRHLAETLRSVLRQEGVAFDVLISDDRSDDSTLNDAREFAGDRVRLVVNSERLGLAGNWNQCVALSRTPFVAVVHQDDLLRPGHLATHVEAFAVDESVGLVASGAGVVDETGEAVPESVVGRGGLGPVDRTFGPGEALPLFTAGNPLRCSAVSMRCAAHADAGGFDPALRYVVDWEFWSRVVLRWSLAWRAAVTVDVRWHAGSETHRFKTGTLDLEESARVLDRLVASLRDGPVAVAPIARVAYRRLARAYLNRSYEGVTAGNPRLARDCLMQALRTSPAVAWSLAADPRLAARLTAAFLAPRWVARRSAGNGPIG